MKSFEDKQFDILHEIAQEELLKIREQYNFEFGGNIESFDENFNQVVIRGYSILNTPLLGITYWHSDQDSDYAIEQLQYYIKTGKREGHVFTTMSEAEEYLKKTKCKFLKNPYTHVIEKSYSTHYNMCGFDSAQHFSQLKHLNKDIKLKKTIIEKGIL